MPPTTLQLWFDGITAVASFAAVGIAIAAFVIAHRTFRRDHRPIVRVVQQIEQPQNVLRLDLIKLKNYGRGPAFEAIVYDPATKSLIGDKPVVEPLGTGDIESRRLGAVKLSLKQPMSMDNVYELYAQDVLGKWHLTRFRPRPHLIECSFSEVSKWKVPSVVRFQATIARP